MICDTVDNLKNYFAQSEAWKKALDFIDDLPESPELGRVDIDGDDVFAVIDRYNTKPVEGAKIETHAKYADIQLLLEGEEIIGWQPKDENLMVLDEYSEEKDIAFYEPTDFISSKLRSGLACVYLPGEYHMPQLNAVEESKEVCKVVVKINASLL